MLCPNCGHFSTTDTTVCGRCGKLLPRESSRDTGVMAIRQGKKAREEAVHGTSMPDRKPRPDVDSRTYVDPDANRPLGSEPIYAAPEVFDANGDPIDGGMYRRPSLMNDEPREIPVHYAPKRNNPITRRSVNWAKVALAGAVLCLMLMMGVVLFLTRTTSGQRIMARGGRDAPSTAYWEVAEEKMDIGDIDAAIENYLKAAELDGDEEVNVAGLLALGSAYEAAGRLKEAEELYVHIYTDIVPSAT